MPRRLTLLICLVALAAPLAVPLGVQAQSSPFAPLPEATTTPDTGQVSTSSTSDDGGGLKGWQEVLIFAGGGILLLGIAWAIVTDARHAAPTGTETETQEEARTRREADLKRRKAKNRAAAKRSRAARKRNR